MAQSLGVTADELRATSRHLHDVSSRMKDVLAALRENLGEAGAAWGDDEIGNLFAKGAAGYLAQLEWVGGSVDAKTALLDFYSEGLKGAADSFESHDGP